MHLIGMTSLFIASKVASDYPLRLSNVFEKIGRKKFSTEEIKKLELDILVTINYEVSGPTVLDFLGFYLEEVLGIGHNGKTISSSDTPEGLSLLIYKLAIYLAKISMHDYDLSGRKPSLVGIGALYVALRICENLKRVCLITSSVVQKMIQVARSEDEEIIEVSQKVLYLSLNFDKVFPGLEVLRDTDFKSIT